MRFRERSIIDELRPCVGVMVWIGGIYCAALILLLVAGVLLSW